VDFAAATIPVAPPMALPLSPRERAKREEALRQQQFLADLQRQVRGVPDSALND